MPTMAGGPILECGSGLTTLLVGVVAQRTGNSVWSLEHLSQWAERVQDDLDKYRIDAVNFYATPLNDYGEYDWYSKCRPYLTNSLLADSRRLTGSHARRPLRVSAN